MRPSSDFPNAEILFAGPRKNYELFAADPRLEHVPVEYPRGSLRERLAVCEGTARGWRAIPDCLVIDPDSRLTQLGLLPVCPEDRYHLFESRATVRIPTDSLPALAARWAEETFGISGAQALRRHRANRSYARRASR